MYTSAGRIISLLTDFGLKDPYVGIMKAVIHRINPSATIIDISHGVSSYDVIEGAYMLYASYRWFPRETIHVVVVDPGVGTERRPVLLKTRNYYFVGPDNGVLGWAASEDGILEAYILDRPKYYATATPSHTFHGRDIFAPAAAWLSRGVDAWELGTRIPVEDLSMAPPPLCRIGGGVAEAEVISIDGFGNVVTACREAPCPPGSEAIVRTSKSSERAVHARTFGDVGEGQLLIHINSLGFLEVSVNMGNAAERLGVIRGERVWIECLK